MRYLSAGARLLLIKHVLSSLPVHLLSVLPVPKQIFGKINRLFSTFFWGSSEGRPKRKWVSWESVCRPVDEGGVGIRNIMEVYSSLQSKFAWKFLSEDTLWSRFFKAKYVKNQHISLVDSSKGSRFWKMLIKSIHMVVDKSIWCVKEGNLSFWRDKWMDTGPICQTVPISALPCLKIKDCMVEQSWDVDLVVQLVGQEVADEIFSRVDGTKTGMDRLIWLGSRDGRFSTKSAWDWLRISVPKHTWTEWIWHSALPKKFSVVMWKAMTNSLSVDERIRRVGISLASKCECCPQGGFEDLDHVLYSGKVAAKIWHLCSSFLGVPYVANRSWLATAEAWFRRTKKTTKVGNLIGLAPCIIIWNLWMWRCSARMEGKKDCVNGLWRKVRYWFHWVGLRLRDSGNLHHRDQTILNELNLPVGSIPKSKLFAVSGRSRSWVGSN
ncbi:hypothetical protein SLA2020_437910 [Shorea laevis]